MRPSDSSPKTLKSLETLRGGSALIVALHHIPWANHSGLSLFVQNGWLFVDFFFVISGFVIALNYSSSIRGFAGDIPNFLIKRFFRLYPLHLVTTLMMLLLVVAWDAVLWQSTGQTRTGYDREWFVALAMNLALLHGTGLTEQNILNGPSWSISTEFFAYIVAALMFWLGAAGRLGALLWCLIIVFSGAMMVAVNGSSGLYGDMTARMFRCLYGFGIGVWAYFLITRFDFRWSGVTATLGQALIWLLVIGAFFVLPLQSQWNFLFPFLFALVVLGSVADKGSAFASVLNLNAGQWLGEKSYSIYMLHSFVVSIFGGVLNRFFDTSRSYGGRPLLDMPLWLGDLCAICYIFLVLIFSHWTFVRIERPWREYGRKIAANPPGVSVLRKAS